MRKFLTWYNGSQCVILVTLTDNFRKLIAYFLAYPYGHIHMVINVAVIQIYPKRNA